MRLVAINHLHPDTAHIGAVRVPRFAALLAERGHRVVLLTASRSGDDVPPADPATLRRRLAAHDWSRCFPLACPPRPRPLLAAAREGRLARAFRLPVLAWHYGVHGGVFTDWRDGSRPFWPLLAEAFRPEITWGTFGNTDAWAIAQGVARLGGCPWVLDIKDVWDQFIPRPVSRRLIRRFGDAAAATGISQGHLDRSLCWGRMLKTPIYSGIPAAFLAPAAPAVPFRITVSGSCYGRIDTMIEGTARFLDRLPADQRGGVVFTYAGAEHPAVIGRAAPLAGRCRLDLRPYVPVETLATLQREAFANLYGRLASFPEMFPHKVFELIAADRPILCCPGEFAEAMGLYRAMRADVQSCPDAAAVATGLERAWHRRREGGDGIDRAVLAGYTWEAQAARLEAVLSRAARVAS